MNPLFRRLDIRYGHMECNFDQIKALMHCKMGIFITCTNALTNIICHSACGEMNGLSLSGEKTDECHLQTVSVSTHPRHDQRLHVLLKYK